MSGQTLFNIGLMLVFVGFAVTFIAIVLLVFASVKGRRKIRGGGAVIIGPFPIVFGTDKEFIKILLVLAIALVILLLVVMVLSARIFG